MKGECIMLSVILQALGKYPQVWSATTRDAMLRTERMRESLWWNIIITSGLFYRWISVDGKITHITRDYIYIWAPDIFVHCGVHETRSRQLTFQTKYHQKFRYDRKIPA
jgi:hypothetical protein